MMEEEGPGARLPELKSGAAPSRLPAFPSVPGHMKGSGPPASPPTLKQQANQNGIRSKQTTGYRSSSTIAHVSLDPQLRSVSASEEYPSLHNNGAITYSLHPRGPKGSVGESSLPTMSAFSCYEIPASPDSMRDLPVPFGCVFSPAGSNAVLTRAVVRTDVAENDTSCEADELAPVRCRVCSAYLNSYCKQDMGSVRPSWKCLFCHTSNNFPDNYVYHNRTEADGAPPALQHKAVEYIIPVDSEHPANAEGVLIVVDQSLAPDEWMNLRVAVHRTLSSLPAGTRVGLMTVSAVCSVYDLNACTRIAEAEEQYAQEHDGTDSDGGDSPIDTFDVEDVHTIPCVCKVVPADFPTSVSSDRMDEIRSEMKSFFGRVGDKYTIRTMETVLRSHELRARRIFRTSASIRMRDESSEPSMQKRCMGSALLLARQIANGKHAPWARAQVVTVIAGHPTSGLGAIQMDVDGVKSSIDSASAFYSELGDECRNVLTVDVFCVGPRVFGVEVWAPIVRKTGGKILTFRSKEQWQYQLYQNLHHAVNRLCGYEGQFAVLCSSPIRVMRVIGSASTREDVLTSAAALLDGVTMPGRLFPKSSPASEFILDSVDACSAVALGMDYDEMLAHDQIFVQFVAQWRTTARYDFFEPAEEGKEYTVLRVETRALPVTSDIQHFSSCSIDFQCSLALISKELAIEAWNAQTEEDLEDVADLIDEVAGSIVSCFATREPRQPTATNPRPYKLHFPDAVIPFITGVYFFRRSIFANLPEHQVQHDDDVAASRLLLISAPLSDTVQMICPQLIEAHVDGRAVELSADTLSLQPGSALFFDAQNEIFMWIGDEAAADSRTQSLREQLRKLLLQSTASSRFPAPLVMEFCESSTYARYLTARLIPGHRDAADVQEGSSSLKMLTDSFKNFFISSQKAKIPTEEMTFDEYIFERSKS